MLSINNQMQPVPSKNNKGKTKMDVPMTMMEKKILVE